MLVFELLLLFGAELLLKESSDDCTALFLSTAVDSSAASLPMSLSLLEIASAISKDLTGPGPELPGPLSAN